MIRRYDFHTAIQKLNTLLKRKQPKFFDPLWIKQHASSVYRYLYKNIQAGAIDVDWDSVTINLDRTFQKRWRWQVTKITSYENKKELNIILAKYQSKLYTLMAPLNKEDKIVQDQIIIRLVRTAQRGNLLAKQHVIECMTFIIYEWMESSPYMVRWKNYTGEIEEKIQACIRNYRYSGSFMTYLFRTFQYSARGLRYTCSLNDKVGKGTKTRIDYMIQEEEH